MSADGVKRIQVKGMTEFHRDTGNRECVTKRNQSFGLIQFFYDLVLITTFYTTPFPVWKN